MADLVDYLDKLNAKRADLQSYGRRIRKVRWLFPGTVKDLLRELDDRWSDVSKERERTLEVIWADPVLSQKMKDRERQAKEDASKRLAGRQEMSALSGKPYVVSQDIREIACRVVGLEREEALAQHNYDEAQFYYGSGAWQNDGVEVGKLTQLLDRLMLERDRVFRDRHSVIDGLNTRLRLDAGRLKEPVSMVQHKVLESVRGELPEARPVPAKDSPLAAFLRKEMPRPEPTREPAKKLGHSR